MVDRTARADRERCRAPTDARGAPGGTAAPASCRRREALAGSAPADAAADGDLGHRLYIAGHLGFDDSRLLSCQPELHPDYATTVARLTGRRPAPDAPRDHVGDWERRLAFALRYTPDDDERIGRIQRIVSALTRLAVTASPPPPYRTRE